MYVYPPPCIKEPILTLDRRFRKSTENRVLKKPKN
jgi:hypothetical protein